MKRILRLSLFLLLVFLLLAPSLGLVAKEAKPLVHFVQISDTHLDYPNKKDSTRLLGSSEKLLSTLVKQINEIKDLDFVLSTGDLVNRPDKKLIEKYIEITNKLKYPQYVLLGNHDATIDSEVKKSKFVKMFYEKNGKKSFTSGKSYYSFSPNDKVTVICLDGSIDTYKTSTGRIDEKQLKWLKNELKENKNKKVIIALHYPIVEPFKSPTHHIIEPDRTKLKNLINDNPNVIGVFTGHYHAAKLYKIRNKVHNSCPAIIEYPCAFREVIIEQESPDKIAVDFKWHVVDEPELVALSKKHSKSWRLKQGAPEDREQTMKLKTYRLLP